MRTDATRFDPRFLEFQFASPYGKDYFLRHAKQTTGIACINRRVLSQFPLLIPPLGAQRRIANRLQGQLAAVAAARAAVQAQLEAAHALPAALLRAVFDSPTAKKWPRRPLGEVCGIATGQVNPTLSRYRDLPHVNGENIVSGTGELHDVRSASEDGVTSGKYLFEQGEVLYSKLRPYLRKVAVAPFRGLCSADMYPLRPHSSVMDPHFTAWLLLSQEFTTYAVETSQRSRMPKLNREQLFAWHAPVPPLTDQQSLVVRLDAEMATATALRERLAARLAEIECLPAALLREAFSGGG